jgi:UDP-glucuronate decarboxylase
MVTGLKPALFVMFMASPYDCIGPINIGNPYEFTIKALATLVVELTGSKSELIYEPLPSDDPVQRRPNIDRAKESLDWQPKIELKEGLMRTIPYFQKFVTEAN